jgi:hypothetical protein
MFYGFSFSKSRQLVPVESFHRGWSAVPPSEETHSASGVLFAAMAIYRNLIGELDHAPLRH